MLETTITIVATILSLEAGHVELDPGARALLHRGDHGVVYQLREEDDRIHWMELGPATVVDRGGQPSLDTPFPIDRLTPGDRVVFEVDTARLLTAGRGERNRGPRAAAPASAPPAPHALPGNTSDGRGQPRPGAATALAAVSDMPRQAPAPPTVAEPTPPEPQSTAPTTTGVAGRVRAWARAWERQQVDAYLAFYARAFRPARGDRGTWAAQRRERLTQPSSITVDLDQIEVQITGVDRATVTFQQRYTADHFRDEVRKQLDLVWQDDDWYILAETVAQAP